jgi:hypothetical protein
MLPKPIWLSCFRPLIYLLPILFDFPGSKWSWSYGSWIYNHLCNQGVTQLTLLVRIPLRRCVLDTALCDKVCQWLTTVRWFSPVISVSSTNKTDRQDIIESGVEHHKPQKTIWLSSLLILSILDDGYSWNASKLDTYIFIISSIIINYKYCKKTKQNMIVNFQILLRHLDVLCHHSPQCTVKFMSDNFKTLVNMIVIL